MPRRLIRALFAFTMLTVATPVAAAPHDDAHHAMVEATFQQDWSGEGAYVEEEWSGEGAYVEDEWSAEGAPVEENWSAEGTYVEEDPAAGEYVPEDFSGFTMPGLTPDNFTETVLADIDAFWAEEFAANGNQYYSAGIIPVSEVTYSSCGNFGPYDNPAAFCPLDDAVYYSIPLSQEIHTTIGDFAWITVLAHEWGHHVQLILGIVPEQSIDRELQADCFAGAYARRALLNGYLQEGDVTEAVLMNIMGGDPVEMGETVEGAHGSSDYRVTSFMEGYFNGTSACMAG